MTYTVVDVTPDTPEWLEERRRSVGASEVPAVMNLSAYGVTPFDIYRSKHGIDKEFDPILALIGHMSEPIMHEYVEKHSGLHLELLPGFMARSVEHPFLHASFDRVTADGLKVQMKTSGHYAGHHWDEGIPTDIRVQVQAEMAVSGDSRELVVVMIGGREFRHYWEPRDDRFINEFLIPQVGEFWNGHVALHNPPPAAAVRELADRYPSEAREIDLSEAAFEVLERITVLNSDIRAQEQERDALKVELANYVGTADTLTYEGQKVATYKTQKGRASFDAAALKRDHPELVADYTTQGSPFKVLRRTKEKQ